jgi:hypothetical protein
MIYVCSAFGGKKENLDKAVIFGKEIIKQGDIPIIPHLFYGGTGLLDDNIPAERETGLGFGVELLDYCHELWVFTTEDNPTITKGMQNEIDMWIKSGREVKAKYIFKEGM